MTVQRHRGILPAAMRNIIDASVHGVDIFLRAGLLGAMRGQNSGERNMAEVRSAHRLEPNLGLIPLSAKEVRTRWETMKSAANVH